MTVLELGENISISGDGSTLHMDGYGSQFSTYWRTESGLWETLETASEMLEPDPNSKVVLDGEESQDLRYRQLEKETLDQMNVDFASINTDEYSLSWEIKDTEYQVGITSNQEIPEKVVTMFKETTDSEVSLQDREKVSEFISYNVRE
jgi:hypothetical protein